MDSGRLQPAFYGGLFIGVLSALPLVSGANCCCCAWAVAGGMLAVYLRQQNSPYVVPASEGALVGLMSGAIGGVIFILISIPLAYMLGPWQQQLLERVMSGAQDMPPEVRDMLENATAASAFRVVGLVLNAMAFTVFGLLGGLLGVAVFKKDAPPPPPPGTVEVLPPE